MKLKCKLEKIFRKQPGKNFVKISIMLMIKNRSGRKFPQFFHFLVKGAGGGLRKKKFKFENNKNNHFLKDQWLILLKS